MRNLSFSAACITLALATTAGAAVKASKTPNYVIGAEATRLLDEIGLPASQCNERRRIDVVGSFVLPIGYSGSVGELVLPTTLPLRIDSAVSRIFDAEQFAGAIGTWTKGDFAWRTMGQLPESPIWSRLDGLDGNEYWVYPNPVGRLPRPLYADPGALVKVEANRSGSSSYVAHAMYGIRGCVVDSIP